MLSIGTVTIGNRSYHTEQVAMSAEEYYSGRGEAEGHWLGADLGMYSVGGKVEPNEFLALLDGVDRSTGELFASSFSRRKNLGYDLVFNAPKSVSLMYAVGDESVKKAIVDAHDSAVRAGFGYLEEIGAYGRERVDGDLKAIRGDGLVAATYRHRTSRLGEPHLHSHVVAPNMIKIGTDKWTSLDSKRLFHHAKAAGTLYQVELRKQLSRVLGVEWGEVENGCADVAGFDQEQIDAFSSRRAQIEADLGGPASVKAKIKSARNTRPTKEQSKVDGDLFEVWKEQLEESGVTRSFVRNLCGKRALKTRVTLAEQQSIFNELDASKVLVRDRAYYDRRRVIEAIGSLVPTSASPSDVQRMADEWIEKRAVKIAEQGKAPVQDAEKIIAAGSRTLSTPAQIAVEDQVLAEFKNRVGNGAGEVSDALVEHGMKVHGKELSIEQRDMVTSILSSGNGVDVVVGDAGTGKTFALDALRKIYEDGGYRVLGSALAARAARELGEGASISSTTLHRTLRLLDEQQASGRKIGKTVLLIDEAGMVDTEMFARILGHPATQSMKIVLVGDDKQLPPIGPGGMFRAAAETLGNSRLTENRRQRDEIDRQIVADFRDGNGAAGLTRANLHGRVSIAYSRQDALANLYAAWSADVDKDGALMIAARREDVRQLNLSAQSERLALGELGKTELRCGVYSYRVGDVVRCGSRDERRIVENGDFGVVQKIDVKKREVTVAIDRFGEELIVTLPREYVTDPEKFRLGYAITAHTAQGATRETVYTYMDDMLYRELAYTQVSRAKGQTYIFVEAAAPQTSDDPGYNPYSESSEFEDLVSALATSKAQAPAVAVGKVDLFAEWTTEQLVDELASRRERVHDEVALAVANDVAGEESDSSKKQKEMLHDYVAEHPEDAQSYRDLVGELEQRIAISTRKKLTRPPQYLAAELGPVPEDTQQREYWYQAALEIERYRTRWQISGNDDVFSLRSAKKSVLADPRYENAKRVERAVSLKRMIKLKKAIDDTPITIRGRSL